MLKAKQKLFQIHPKGKGFTANLNFGEMRKIAITEYEKHQLKSLRNLKEHDVPEMLNLLLATQKGVVMTASVQLLPRFGITDPAAIAKIVSLQNAEVLAALRLERGEMKKEEHAAREKLIREKLARLFPTPAAAQSYNEIMNNLRHAVLEEIMSFPTKML